MRRRIIAASFATLCALSLAACANGLNQAGQAGDNSGLVPSSSASSPATIVPTSPASLPPITHGPITLPSPEPSGGQITISGTVQVGAEPSCLTVTDSGREYLLLTTKPNQIQDGDVVKVTGQIMSGIMTHCMQGIPFQVSTVNILSSH